MNLSRDPHTEDVQAVYGELRKIAAIRLARGVRHPSIQATQLVHEAWIKLADQGWRSRTHFLALASRAMRYVLLDAVRARMAGKREGQWLRRSLEARPADSMPGLATPLERIVELNQALDRLAAEDERKARVVEMRFFGGMEFQEIAEALEVSLMTVKRDWRFSRAWLYTELTGEEIPEE